MLLQRRGFLPGRREKRSDWVSRRKDTADTGPRNKKQKKKGGVWRFFKRLFIVVLIICVLLGSVVAGAMMGFIDNSTDLIAQEYNLDFTSMVYYIDEETGKPVEMDRLYSEQNRIWVDLANVPKNLKNAFIAIEDERFLTHKGVDWKRTFGAVVTYLFRGNKSYGGSTITQQLIKNITGDDERSPIRKIQEIVRALNLERKMSKDQIIEMYMNTIYLGQGCHGVQAASNIYFSKDVSELTLEECASIAGITQYPSKYDPLVNYDANKEKQELVLNKMAELGYISQAECDEAKAKELKLKKGTTKSEKDKIQSYYIDQIIMDVMNDLMTRNKMTEAAATKEVFKGGLKIYTAMDPKVQSAIETVFTNEKNFSGSGSNKPQAAMMVIDPYTGYIKGMVGGRGEKTGNRVLNRATQTKRQPGSAIKPLSVYAPAIEYGLITPATIVDDSKLKIGDWEPRNSDNVFKGNITVQYALEESRNIPAVRILDKLTVDKSYDFLTKNLNITSLVSNEKRADGKTYSDKFYSSLGLGGLTDGISLKELTAGYSAFVNGGVYTKPVTYTKVIDAKGRVILENKPETIKAMSDTTAYIMANMMTGVVNYGTGTRAKLANNVLAGGKTGTTTDQIDLWFAGFTPNYVGAVWYGYDTPKKMSGSNPCPGLWKKVMDLIHKDVSVKTLEQPKGVTQTKICKLSGKIATGLCESNGTARVAYFKSGTQPGSICSSHAKVDPEGDDKIDDEIENEDKALSDIKPGSGATNPPAEGDIVAPSTAPSPGSPATSAPDRSQPETGGSPDDDTLDWWDGE